MAVTSASFYVYEKLASAKMNSLVTDINAHTHDGTYGTKIDFGNLTNVVITASQIPNSTITSAMIVNGTIVAADIADCAITLSKLDYIGGTGGETIKLSSDGYAVYAP